MSTLSRIPRRRAGFSLVEVVLALGVVSVAVLALIGILGTTFTSAREIALQHAAINAISQFDGVMKSPVNIIDMPPANSPTDPAFNRVYRLLSDNNALDGKKFVDFFVYQKTAETPTGAPTPAVSAVYLPTTGKFLLTEAKSDSKHEGINTSTTFRMRVRLSRLLENKLCELDPTTFEAKPNVTWAVGRPLKPSPDDYALAYLPLTVEIYTHDFSDATDPGNDPDPAKARVRPVLSLPLVLNR